MAQPESSNAIFNYITKSSKNKVQILLINYQCQSVRIYIWYFRNVSYYEAIDPTLQIFKEKRSCKIFIVVQY